MTLFGRIRALPGRWRASLGGAVILLLIIFLFPFKTTIVPRWRLRVVDATGALVRDIKVTEHWQHYLLEGEGHEEVTKTDETGVVDFPARTIRASIASRIVGTIANFARQGASARFGPYASIVIWGSRDYETAVAVYRPEAPPENEIIVHAQE